MAIILLSLFSGFLRLFPLGWVCAWGRAAGALLFVLDRRHARLAVANMRMAFPGKPEAELKAIARRMFMNLGEGVLELLTYRGATQAYCLKHMSTENERVVHETMQEGKGFIFLTAHYGNWELLGILGSVVVRNYRVCAVGRASRRADMDKFIQDLRESGGMKMLAKGDALRGVLAMLRQGQIASFLADQIPGADGMSVDFFGRPTAAMTMPARLSLKTGAPIIPAFIERMRAGHHRISYGAPLRPERRGDLEEDVRRLTQQGMRVLEERIRQRPDHWFWLHKRWKSKKAIKSVQDTTRIALIAPHWLGDAVMSLPAQAMLRGLFPDAHITVFFPKGQEALYGGLHAADERAAYGWRPEGFGGRARLAFLRRLRSGRYDMAVLMPNSWDSAFCAWLAGIRHRVGYAAHGRSPLLSLRCDPAPGKGQHQAERYRQLIRFLGQAPESALPVLRVSEGDKAWAEQQWGIRQEGFRRVALHPGAAYGPTKRWFPERFIALAEALAAEGRAQVMLLGSDKEKAALAPCLARGKVPVLDSMGKTDLGKLLALLQSADVLIANDSGPMHLAALTRTPVVAVFGSTDPSATAPLGAHSIVRKPLPCSPCLKRRCANAAHPLECLDAISVQDVLHSFDTMICFR